MRGISLLLVILTACSPKVACCPRRHQRRSFNVCHHHPARASRELAHHARRNRRVSPGRAERVRFSLVTQSEARMISSAFTMPSRLTHCDATIDR